MTFFDWRLPNAINCEFGLLGIGDLQGEVDLIHPPFFAALNKFYFMEFFDWRLPYALNRKFGHGGIK